MPKRTLLFAPAAFNLAETTRMVEIAKGIVAHPEACKVFDIQFISDGGDFERLIESHGFPLQRLEPRLTREKIEHIARVDRGEKFAPAFSQKELIERINSEVSYLGQATPAAVITGSYLTIPVTCRVLKIPLVWAIQSTWLEPFFSTGAGMTDGIRPRFLKRLADLVVLGFINFWIRYGFLNPVNRAARHFGVEGYTSIFDFWRGDMNLVAEPPEFSGIELPPSYHYVGPLIAREEFPLPPEAASIPRDMPLIYFAMGSSGTPEIVASILQGFEGKPYRIIAPIKFQLQQLGAVKIPPNVIVTDWLPALQVNKMVDLSLIHGGIGTVMTAAYAGKPVVGVGMQPEQVANLACLVRKGFAVRVPKSSNPSLKVQAAIERLLEDEEAKRRAEEFAQVMAKWDGSRTSAELLFQKFGQ
ncbi:MAG: glycosyltransferase [Candidatus Sulfotelmatobacter sp.]